MSFREMRCTSFTESSQSSHTLHSSLEAGSTNCSTVSSHKLTAPEHPAAPQPPSRPPWNVYKFRPIVHISSFAYCLKIALSLCKRNETNILYCCCEQFTIPSSYSVFFLCPLYTCLHRGPGISNKVNSFSESVIFM